MPTLNIPKLARNKYNYIEGADGNMYMTQSQMVMSTGSGGGGGGGGNNVIPSQWEYKVEQMLEEKGFITSDDVKTVNGYSLIGDGDITVGSEGVVDLSNYMTKEEMSSYVSNDDLERAGYLSQSYLATEMSRYATIDTMQTALGNYVTYSYLGSSLDDYATKSYVDSKIESAVLDGIDMSAYATKIYVDANLNVHDEEMKTYVADYVTAYAPTADLGIYVTKVQLAAAGYLTQHQSLEAYATKSELEPLASKAYVNEQIESAVFDGVDMSAYATKAYVQQYVYSYSPTSDMSIYVTKVNLAAAGYLTQHQSLTAYAKKDELSAYATKSYVNEQIESAVFEGVDMSSYATKSYVQQYVYSYSPTSDLSIYVTKVDLAAAGYLTQHQSLDAYATKVELQDTSYELERYVEDYVDSVALDGVDLSSYVTKDYLTAQSYLTSVPSEYVTKTFLSGQSYLQSVPEGYVTNDELTRMSYATTSYVTSECEAIKEACYAYTESKQPADLSSYVTRAEFSYLVDAIISYMKQSGDLVDATYVTEKIAEIGNP